MSQPGQQRATSPIVSPTRRRRDRDDEDESQSRLSYSPLSSFVSEGTGAPPAYSSPSRSVGSSKYSSLMQYLDSELGDADGGGGGFDDDDDVSSMSMSPAKKPLGRATAPSSSSSQTFLATSSVKSYGRSYVWDDWNNGASGARAGTGASSHKSTVSNLTDYGDDDEAAGGENATYFSLAGSKSLHNVVGEIKLKVEAMKGELAQLHQGVREKQSQLARLATAKAQRVQKFKSLWSTKLASQREEQAAALKKSRDFVERIDADVKQLRAKRDGLKSKQASLVSSSENALQLLQDEVSRKMARARRQWEVEEKVVFDKVLLGKQEAMKKAAAESFGPSLDKMVMEGKEAVRARADECYKRLDKIKRELAADLEEKLAQARESTREQLKLEQEKSRRGAERKLEEALRKQTEEMDALKLKFSREKKMAEETAERTRRNDAEVSLEGMREVRKAEAQQVMETMAAQQRELGQVVHNHGEAMVQLKVQLQAREAEFVAKVQAELEAEQGSQKERARSSILSRANAESEKVIAKLREEILAERKARRDAIEAELDELRISAQQRLDAIQVSENRAIERTASLRGEIDSYRRELASLDEEQADKAESVSEVRSQLMGLRMELADLKEDSESAEHRFNQERTRRRAQVACEEERVAHETRAAEEALAMQEVAIANRREDARHMYETDLSRIRDKVGALLTKKDAAAKDLRRQLTLLQSRAAELDALLDESREKWVADSAPAAAAAAAGTLEEAFARVGMPPSKSRQGRTFI